VSSSPAWPQGYALKHLTSVDSTNEEARRIAASGAISRLWITADEQTAGRGRRGRQWETGKGNLAATLLLPVVKSLSETAQLSFVAAIAACDMAASFTNSHAITVKWPNDVLCDGRKLAGILLESAGSGTANSYVAVGIGMNLAHSPSDTLFPATSLAAVNGSAPPLDDALRILAANLAKWYDAWMDQGFAPIRDAWLARAGQLGGRVTARLADEETSGTFEGIDMTGALILRQAYGQTRAISAGEVFFS
jgi:BirA family biotin operon repressor/biotin-[acetyl-CoA-carboxylase] ligase